MTKIDLFNARSCGEKLEDGTQFVCTDCGTYQDTDKDGNAVTASAYVSADGKVYTGIGAGLAESTPALAEILEDYPAGVEVVCNVQQTKSGRDFKTIRIIAPVEE